MPFANESDKVSLHSVTREQIVTSNFVAYAGLYNPHSEVTSCCDFQLSAAFRRQAIANTSENNPMKIAGDASLWKCYRLVWMVAITLQCIAAKFLCLTLFSLPVSLIAVLDNGHARMQS